MSIKCDLCGRESVEYVRYSGAHLCERHFSEFFERRVKREIASQIRIRKKATIGVGLSGGKDSSTALYLIHKIFSRHRNVSIVAITIDEGIAGYRNKTLKSASQLCKMLDVEHRVYRFEDIFHTTLDEILKGRKSMACTFCGVLRRKALNTGAKDAGCTVLATGLNLDDTVQSILMNFTRGDLEKLARMGPHRKIQQGLVPRIMPLRSVPEREVYLYALLKKIPFSHAVCPYANFALRNEYRALVDALDKTNPSVKFSILKSYDELLPVLSKIYPQKKLRKCRVCGEPSISAICKACELSQKIAHDS